MRQGEKMGARHPDKREQRINRQTDYERVRSALRAGAYHGCYVFDALMTDEAGLLDYLVVGTHGITAIVVRDEHGDVQPDRQTGELTIIRSPFEDDPRRQVADLLEDVERKLSRTDVPTFRLICFTHAEVKLVGDPEADKGLCQTWGLPRLFEEDHEEFLDSAEVDELARAIESIYARPPFVRPGEPYGGQTI